METGTLKDLNVKPGDVVGNKHGSVFETALDECGCICDKTDMCRLSNDYEFTLVSRAATPDLTAITTPFGLLDEATQEALRAHGGPYEMWDGEEWDEGIPSWYGDCTYRVKPGPLIENAHLYIYCRGHKAPAFIQLKDGKPDWSTLQVRHD